MIGLLSLIPGGRMVQGLVVAALITSAVGGVGYAVHRYNDGLRGQGRAEVQKKWDGVEADRAEQLALVKQKAASDTQALQNKADTQRKEQDDQINTLNGNLRRAIDSLRDRPARPSYATSSSVPAPAAVESSASGCTGQGLFRDDGEFLTRLAGEADQLRINLKACYKQYEAAAEALK